MRPISPVSLTPRIFEIMIGSKFKVVQVIIQFFSWIQFVIFCKVQHTCCYVYFAHYVDSHIEGTHNPSSTNLRLLISYYDYRAGCAKYPSYFMILKCQFTFVLLPYLLLWYWKKDIRNIPFLPATINSNLIKLVVY